MRHVAARSDDPSLRGVFAALDAIQEVVAVAHTPDELLVGVLDRVLDLLDCDRAWLTYPCDPDAPTFVVEMERTRPEWPGAGVIGESLPTTAEARRVFEACLESDDPVRLDTEEDDDELLRRFPTRTMLAMAIRPKGDRPWLFGVHDCRVARDYAREAPLLRAIGNRIADGLTHLLALRRLQQKEEHLRRIVEHAPDAIVIFDLDQGRFVEANGNALALFGVERDVLLSQGGPADYSPEYQPDGQRSADVAAGHMEAALAGGTPHFEWVHRDADGNELPCEVRLVALPHATRRLVRGSIVDIRDRRRDEAERRELEARLRQAQKMEAIGQLSGGVAHDFNNLLTVVLGNLELLEPERLGGDDARRCLEDIRSAADRARSLTQQLLAFSRRQPLRPTAVDLARLLRDMDGMLRRTLREDIDVDLVLGGGLWRCEADATQLQNALLNLALNARDAMPAGGRLTIEANNARLDREYAEQHVEVRPGQYVCLAVSDEGVGIPAHLLERVFSPFFTTKQGGTGSGMGLAMVYGFAKQSGGHVKLYSEPGRGTTVRLYLPRAEIGVREADHEPALAAEGQGQLVLVVEDAADVRSLTCAMLESLGYAVLEANDGPEALERLEQHADVELLLTDVVLPGPLDGGKLARAARERRPGLAVLYMSGYTENAILHHGRLDPGVLLLEKPFTRRMLSNLVRQALAKVETR